MNKNLILDNIQTINKLNKIAKYFIVIFLGSLLFAISARIKIDIPPVPVTLQTLVLLVFAMTVGWRISLATFTLYLFEGSIGLPFFTNPPYGGFPYLLGPSGGYLLGMLIASFLVGYLAEKNYDKQYLKSLLSIFLGTFTIFFFGIIWLTYWLSIQPETTIVFLCEREAVMCNTDIWNFSQSLNLALVLGLFKFLLTEPIKIALAASITPLIWSYLKK
jgi:biotin transport system substrate-specific component